MTKPGWNPNAPLTMDEMELIGIVGQPIGQDLPPGQGFMVNDTETHRIKIPLIGKDTMLFMPFGISMTRLIHFIKR